MTWTRPEDLSVDPLAGETLLDRSSHERARTRSSSMNRARIRSSSANSAPVELSRFNSAMSISDTREMPSPGRPPPVPPLPLGNFDRRQPIQQTLSPPISKPKTPTKGNLKSTRPIISAPILSDSGPSDNALLSKFDGAYLQDNSSPRNTSADAANLSQKISHLVQQAAAQETQNDARPEKSPRPSPLQRSKKALVKATRALAVRISSSSSSIGKQASSSVHEDRLLSSSNGSVPSSADPSTDNSPTRIELRKAEAENLRRDKVQRVMGDGFVQRKPLPGSMVARPCSPDPSIEDPFVEEQIEMAWAMDKPGLTRRSAKRGSRRVASSSKVSLKATDSLGRPMAEFSVSPSAVSGKGKQAVEGVSLGNAVGVATPVADRTPPMDSDTFSGQTQKSEKLVFAAAPLGSPIPPAGHTSPRAFSDSVSGLAQHPDVMHFTSRPKAPKKSSSSTLQDRSMATTQSPSSDFLSSSPVGFSTPRVRLEPQSTPDGKKRLAIVPSRHPSYFDFNLPKLIESDKIDITSSRNRIINRTLSVKRKSAAEDLRSQSGPAKRTKKDSVLFDGLHGGSEMSSEFDPLCTTGRQVLTAKNTNEMVSKYSNGNTGTMEDTKNGSTVSEASKGKGTPVANEKKSLTLHETNGAGKRSMLPRPVNGSHGLAQKSHSQLPQNMNDPEAEVDELHTWDQAYHVGGMKRQ